MEKRKDCNKKPSVLMIPWFAHGHITPFFELAKQLSTRNFHIYFCSTPINLSYIKENLLPREEHSISSSIDLVELHLSPHTTLPPHLHTTKGLPLHLIPTLREALDSSIPNIISIIQSLNPHLFIYDIHFPWPLIAEQDSYSSPLHKIPSILFFTGAAANACHVYHAFACPGVPFPSSSTSVVQQMNSPAAEPSISSESDLVRFRITQAIKRSSDIVLIKSSRKIDAEYIDYISLWSQKKFVPTGLLVLEDHAQKKVDPHHVIGWLAGKEKRSTLYVSFGSECFLSKQELEEIACGLELSRVNFIWVVRFPKGDESETEEALPNGFLERTKGRGLVVEGWAPQVEILKHSSTGGFVSHCGWGSVSEGLTFGVPIIAMPMRYDQPKNAKLVAEIGVGLEINRDEDDKYERGGIASAMREMMAEQKGEEMRRRARELAEKVRDGGEEEIDAVVKELLHLSASWEVPKSIGG